MMENSYDLVDIKEDENVKCQKAFINCSFANNKTYNKLSAQTDYSMKLLKNKLQISYTTYINGYRINYTLALMTEKQLENSVDYIAQKAWFGCQTRQESRYRDFQWISPGAYAEDLRKKVYVQTFKKLVPLYKRIK